MEGEERLVEEVQKELHKHTEFEETSTVIATEKQTQKIVIEEAVVLEYGVDDEHSPERCFATGPGLKKAVIGRPAKIKIITIQPGLLLSGDLTVTVAAVRSTNQAVLETEDSGDNTYFIKYTCPTAELYNIAIQFFGNHIPGSPFAVNVLPSVDASKCNAFGPALEKDAKLFSGTPLRFFVDTTEAGDGDLIVIIRGSKEDPKAFIQDQGTRLYTVDFRILQWGDYYANVWWGDHHVPGSPFKLIVHPHPNADKVKVWGAGIEEYVAVNEPAEFYIETKDAGLGKLTIKVTGPKDSFRIDATPVSVKHPRTLLARYDPNEIGKYTIEIRWVGKQVPRSPFHVNVFDPTVEDTLDEETRPNQLLYDSDRSTSSEELDLVERNKRQMARDLERVLITDEEAAAYATMLQERASVPQRHDNIPFAPRDRGQRLEGVKQETSIVIEGSKEEMLRPYKIVKPKKPGY